MSDIFIKKLSVKDGVSDKGAWKKWILTDQNNKMYDSWIRNTNPWNLSWAEGQTIQVEPSQIAERDWNGKKFYTINPIKSGGSGNAMASQVINDKLEVIMLKTNLLVKKQDEILELLKNFPLPGGNTRLEEIMPDDLPNF